MRSDDQGIFWQDVSSGKRGQYDRPTPPIPLTGWRPPEEYPDLSNAKMISIDTETFDPQLTEMGPGVRREGYVAGLAVGVDTGERWYFPIAHKLGGNLPREHVFKWARDNLTRPNQPKLGANILYDLDYLAEQGVEVEGPFWDVQIAEPLLNELAMSYELEAIAERHMVGSKVDELLYEWCAKAYGGKPTRHFQAGNIWRAPVQIVGPYAEGDVDLPFKIFEKQKKELEAQNLWELFELESDLIPMLLAMRRRGVRVDLDAAFRFKAEATKNIDRLVKELGGINVYASEDLARLCRKEGIKHPLTEKGNPSFRKEWLSNHPHPSLRKVTEVRTLLKLRDTFVDGYILGNHVKGRIHAQFNQLRSDEYGTVSGRFSSSNPNLQNIPKRTEMGKLIRAMFLPDEGEDWDRLDWSQIEFRLLVHYAIGVGAEKARNMYRSDPKTDFHMMVCEMVNKIVPIERDPAKNINFGLVYGMGEELLASILGKTMDEVRDLFDGYHAAVPFVKRTYNAASNRAKERGYIKTILNRRRRFPNGDFTHKALNGLLQGGAADIMKKAMVMIWHSGVCEYLGAPLLTVHDELDLSKPKGRIYDEAMEEVKHIMQTCVPLSVPLIAEHERGSNWGNCKVVASAH